MEKNGSSKKVVREVKTSLASVAASLKGKELFPKKVAQAKLFFDHLEPSKK